MGDAHVDPPQLQRGGLPGRPGVEPDLRTPRAVRRDLDPARVHSVRATAQLEHGLLGGEPTCQGCRPASSALCLLGRGVDPVEVALPPAEQRRLDRGDALYVTARAGSDVRRVTGYQDFVDNAPLDLVFVADHGRMKLVPAGDRQSIQS